MVETGLTPLLRWGWGRCLILAYFGFFVGGGGEGRKIATGILYHLHFFRFSFGLHLTSKPKHLQGHSPHFTHFAQRHLVNPYIFYKN